MLRVGIVGALCDREAFKELVLVLSNLSIRFLVGSFLQIVKIKLWNLPKSIDRQQVSYYFFIT